MRLFSFLTLTVLALLYAGLTVAETAMYQRWDRAQVEQRELRNKIALFQQFDQATQQLLRRLAIESQRDPAIVDLLRKHQVRVITPTADQVKAAATAPAIVPPPAANPSAQPPATPAAP